MGRAGKLSPATRIEVARRLDAGESPKALADEYGVSKTTLHYYKNREKIGKFKRPRSPYTDVILQSEAAPSGRVILVVTDIANLKATLEVLNADR